MLPPAPVAVGVRLTRRSGKYRQSFEVENSNRIKAREVATVTSYAQDNSEAEAVPKDGRLKVSTQRDFTPQVPFEFQATDNSLKWSPNPVNMMGALLEDMVPVVTTNTLDDLLAAFAKRCNFAQGKDDDDISDEVYYKALALIDALPDDMFVKWEENDEDRKRWLDKFDCHKRKRMEEGYAQIPDQNETQIGTKDLSVKLEVLLKRMDPKWAPRVIYAGNDCFNAVTGPASMVVMERLVQVLEHHKVGCVNVKLAYKTDDVSIVEFLNDDRMPNTYEGDFSANDREQRSRVAMIYDAWLNKLGLPDWFRTLLLSLEHFKVRSFSMGIRASLKYQLPTGTTSTTPRNSTYNLTMFAVACARQRIKMAKAVVLGDDILARTQQKFSCVLWKQTVDMFKMVLKGKEVELSGSGTLLSRRLIIDGDVNCMIPLIGKAIARFNARANLSQEVTNAQYMAGKSLSYAYEFRHVPFMRDAFLQRYEMEGSSAVTMADLTWFARSNVTTVKEVVNAVKNERVLVNDDMFLDWLMRTYGIGLCDLNELIELTILNQDLEFITHPCVENLSIDW